MLFTFLGASLLLVVFRKSLVRDGPAFTSLFQGTVRFNTYIGLTIILYAMGESGMLVAAVIMATLIPLVNILSVAVLLRHGRNSGGRGWRAFIVSLCKNPVVVACVVGIILQVARIEIVPPLADTLAILGKAALPLGLLSVGAALDFRVFQASRLAICAACLLKLVFLPFLMFLGCRIFAVQGVAAGVALLFAALPGSALSFILARQLGGDSRLMSAIVTAQTCLAPITMPLVLGFFSRFI